MINPNQSPIDQYTLLHFGFGMALRSIGFGAIAAVGTSMLWEFVIEPYYKEKNPEIFPAPSQDSNANRFYDTAAVLAGWWFLRKRS